jgi:hypothetical protein
MLCLSLLVCGPAVQAGVGMFDVVCWLGPLPALTFEMRAVSLMSMMSMVVISV